MTKKNPLVTLDSPRELLEILDFLLCSDLEDKDIAKYARGLLAVLRKKGLKFQDPDAQGDGCVLCLHFSLMDALYKVEEVSGESLEPDKGRLLRH